MNNQNGFIEVLKNILSWICTGVGWMLSDITLSRAALIASIVYSVVNVWMMFERRGRNNDPLD